MDRRLVLAALALAGAALAVAGWGRDRPRPPAPARELTERMDKLRPMHRKLGAPRPDAT